MRKIILAIFITLAISNTAQAKQLNTTSLSHIQKLSVASIRDMSRAECYDYIDTQFRPLQLINYLKNKEVQKKIYDYCQEKGVPYSIVLITFFKESSYRADAWRSYEDGSADVGPAQIHLTAEQLSDSKWQGVIHNPLFNLYEGIYRMMQIEEQYNAYTLLEMNIAYQYGKDRLFEAREGIPVPKAKVFLDGLERGEEYVEKMIKRYMIRQVINEGKTFIHKGDRTVAPLEEVIEY